MPRVQGYNRQRLQYFCAKIASTCGKLAACHQSHLRQYVHHPHSVEADKPMRHNSPARLAPLLPIRHLAKARISVHRSRCYKAPRGLCTQHTSCNFTKSVQEKEQSNQECTSLTRASLEPAMPSNLRVCSRLSSACAAQSALAALRKHCRHATVVWSAVLRCERLQHSLHVLALGDAIGLHAHEGNSSML